MIEDFYSDLKEFMTLAKIDYKFLDEGVINFLNSDIDILIRTQEDLKKIKNFIINYKIKIIIRTDNKNNFYFVVTDNQNIHAFDFSVGLMSGLGVVCSGEYFFHSNDSGIDINKNYKFLKNSAKNSDSFYIIKENKKNLFYHSLLNFKKLFKYVHNIFLGKRNGITLAFLGADGSGKSTALEFIQRNFSEDRKLFPFKKIYFKPNVFKIKPDVKSSVDGTNIPHSHSTYSSLLSVCKVFYVFLNYLFYLPILFLRKKNGHMVLFDRHYYDLLADPKRYRINNAGLRAARLLSSWVPKPDAVIVLTSDISLLAQRKPDEVPIELLTTLNDRYQSFSLKKVKIIHVTNNGSIDKMKDELFNIVLRSIGK
jgi:thymidylate kinase